MSQDGKSNEKSFESALKDLEKIVAELEKGESPLDVQLKIFEQGIALSRECLKRLEEVERRVELITTSGNGQLQATPFREAMEEA